MSTPVDATLITNTSTDAITLPFPLRGVLAAGASIIVGRSPTYIQQTFAQQGLTGLLKLTELPSWTGPIDNAFDAGNASAFIIDPAGTAGGLDTNDGVNKPIKTLTRLSALLAHSIINRNAATGQTPDITITFLSNHTGTDILEIDAMFDYQGAQGAFPTGSPFPGPYANVAVKFVGGVNNLATFTDPNTGSTSLLTLTANVTAPQVIATTIAAGSDAMALPQATISLASVTGLPTGGGNIIVRTGTGTETDPYVDNVVSFTGVSGLTITGCTGGTGTMHLGNWVGMPLPTVMMVTGPTNFDFSPFLGKLVQIMSGSAAGAVGMIEKAPYPGTVHVSPLGIPTAGIPLVSTAQPLSGATFIIYDATTFTAPLQIGFIPNTTFEFQNFRFPTGNDSTVSLQNYHFQGCQIQRQVRSAVGSASASLIGMVMCGVSFAAPASGHSPTQFQNTGGEMRFIGCGFLNVDLRVREFAANVFLGACTMHGSQIMVGGPTDNARHGGHVIVSGAGVYGLHMYDVPQADLITTTRATTGCGIHCGHAGRVVMAAPFAGTTTTSGNLGLRCSEGGIIAVSEQLTATAPANPASPSPPYLPNSLTCCGAGGAFQIDRTANHFVYADLVTALGGPTAKAPVACGTSWQQWEASTGFSRNVTSLVTGASVQNAQV